MQHDQHIQQDRIRLPLLRERVTSAARAAEWIQDGMTVGMSGFTRAGDAKAVPPVCRAFQEIVDAAEGRHWELDRIERFAFYERAKAAFALVVTGERRLYGNLLLKKGIIRPEA